MKPVVRRSTPREGAEAAAWVPWVCGPCSFEWGYAAAETCLVLEGEAVVESGGAEVRVGPGDLIQLPKGLACRWRVLSPVRGRRRIEE